MKTTAGHIAGLAAELRPILERHGVTSEDLAEALAWFMSGYAAGQIEKTCRTPVSQRGPGRKQQEARRSA